MVKHLLIVEEALKNRNGHWYEYNKAVTEEARSRGIEVTLLVHQDIERDVCEELQAIPWFPVTSWDQIYYHPNATLRYFGILRHNLLVARLMTKYFREASISDVVLVPTVVLYHWLAWRWLVAEGTNRWFKKLALTTRNNAGEYDVGRNCYMFNASARVLAKVLYSFKNYVQNGTVTLASDSSMLAEQYTRLSGIPFQTFPHPRNTQYVHQKSPGKDESHRVTISALGPPRYEKGSDLVVEAIVSLLESHPDLPVNYVVQWTEPVYLPSSKKIEIPRRLEQAENVKIIRSSLSSEEYQKRLDEADLLLLPYRRAQYHARLSGIAIEAFQSGASCICITDTWLEDCMDNVGSGLSIIEESSNALAEATLQYVKNQKVYQSRASEQMPKAWTAHSAHAFVDKLMGGY